MTKRKPKHPAKGPRRKPQQQRPTTPGRRSSPAPDDDDDDDDDVIQLSDGEAIAAELHLFIRRPPVTADHVVVVALTPKGEQIVQDRTAAEARRAPVQLSRGIYAACDHWALIDGRRTIFRATWMRETQVISAHQWACGDGHDPTALDGTVESFLVQNQRFAEAQNRLHLDSFEMVQESWKGLFAVQNRRIEALEKDNADLRERLRRVDDVSSEIALEQARVDLETRGRTHELLEKRVLPIAQALVMQHLQQQQLTNGIAAEKAAVTESG